MTLFLFDLKFTRSLRENLRQARDHFHIWILKNTKRDVPPHRHLLVNDGPFSNPLLLLWLPYFCLCWYQTLPRHNNLTSKLIVTCWELLDRIKKFGSHVKMTSITLSLPSTRMVFSTLPSFIYITGSIAQWKSIRLQIGMSPV